MAEFPSSKQQQDKSQALLFVQSLSASQVSGNPGLEGGAIKTPPADLEDGERGKGFFARTWSRKERALSGTLGTLAVILVTLTISLLVVFITMETIGTLSSQTITTQGTPSRATSPFELSKIFRTQPL